MNTLDFCAIDFETANRGKDSACQVGIVRVEGGAVAREVSLMIRPPEDWFEFTHIHGITWEDVGSQPDFAGRWPEMDQALRGTGFLAAHNAPFDRGVLEACCDRIGVVSPPMPWVDTVKVARKVWDIFPTKLNNVCDYFGVELNHHEALSDARACAGIVIRAWQQGWRPGQEAKR